LNSFCNFCQSPQANTGILPKIRPPPLYSRITLPFEATNSGPNKQTITINEVKQQVSENKLNRPNSKMNTIIQLTNGTDF
jgi:hypothetical protein